MLRRIIYASGILGILSLVLVQTGSFASFTATANVSSKITTGNFSLGVLPNPNVLVTGVDSFDANYATNNGSSVVGDSLANFPNQPNKLELNLANLTPGDTYTYSFNVWDSGTIQGLVNNIVYTPQPNPNVNQYSLEGDLTIQVFDGQGNLLGSTTGNKGYTFSTNGYKGTYPNGNYFGPDFIQPEKNGDTTIPGSGEGFATYKVVITYAGGYYNNNYGTNPLVSQNNQENVSIDPLLTINGNTL
jgi:predicted ribosomally synthesized peptide with SipW-like signal peptide